MIKTMSLKNAKPPTDIGGNHVQFRDKSVYQWQIGTKNIDGKPTQFLRNLVRVTPRRHVFRKQMKQKRAELDSTRPDQPLLSASQ